MGNLYEELDAQLVAATESDDRELASEILKKIEDLPVDAQDEAKEASNNMDAFEGMKLTSMSLGLGAEFVPQLKELTLEQIKTLVREDSDSKDRVALILPGTSVMEKDPIHVSTRGNIVRAARGLAIAAAGGVDFKTKLITSMSGSTHTIEDGKCIEVTTTSQPSFGPENAKIRSTKPCQGHLEYEVKYDGKGNKTFAKTGNEHTRCYHSWALVFALGGWVTTSKEKHGLKAIVEVCQRVGDESARDSAQVVVDQWVENADERRTEREIYAKAINHERNEGNVTPEGRLNPRPEISQFVLPSGETVAQAVSALQGQYFTLTIELPLNNVMAKRTTPVVKNLLELADAVATNFAVASQYGGEVKALSVNAR